MTVGDPNAAGALVLVVVLVVGVLAGRAGSRFGLLLIGLVAIVALGLVVAGVSGMDLQGPRTAVADRLAGVYMVAVPPLIAFVAGWIAARASWFGRAIVVGGAVLLLAAFPYAAAASATAGALVP